MEVGWLNKIKAFIKIGVRAEEAAESMHGSWFLLPKMWMELE
jgi:hypothetical protein